MIYTSYIARFKKLQKEGKLPEKSINLLVMRYKPHWLNLEESNMEHLDLLSPSKELLQKFKLEDIDFQEFEKRFKEELEELEDVLNEIEKELKNGKDVCFICCEKDHTECHRKILAEYFTKLNYKWEELLC